MIKLPSLAVRRVFIATSIVTIVVLSGACGLFSLGRGRWLLVDSIYMALITVSTVGFGELPGLEVVPGARLLTMVIIIAGLGAVTYLQSSLTALIVEGTLVNALRRRRMNNKIAGIENHVVVAGVGSTGKHVVEELVAAKTPFVVIDRNREHLERINDEIAFGRMLYVCGDAIEDSTLIAAGIGRASGVVAALTHDRDNLFVTLSARTLNAKARIVAKVTEPETVAKMIRAGATATVSPNIIGGRRLAAEIIHPDVVEFLEHMTREKDRRLRFHDVSVPATSKHAGKRLLDVLVPEENLLVVAVRDSERKFQFNPGREHVLVRGSALIVMGDISDVEKLKSRLADEAGRGR